MSHIFKWYTLKQRINKRKHCDKEQPIDFRVHTLIQKEATHVYKEIYLPTSMEKRETAQHYILQKSVGNRKDCVMLIKIMTHTTNSQIK